MLRILHTSDWHLGHTLHDLPRDQEHQAFLDWLLGRLVELEVDALLITGDVFETANPPARAMRAWYSFLARARQRCEALDIVVIGGNHDSAGRLEAAHPVLQELGITVVGALPRDAERALDLDALVVPLHDATGEIAAWCAAVPFLRTADLPGEVEPGADDLDDRLIAGVRRVYQQALDHARSRCTGSEAVLALGHCYMVGGSLSELSERRILGGNQHALPVDIFPEDVAYVALGHLHRAQKVGREAVRYAGSPIPLAVDEAAYKHQVRLVELDGKVLASSESLLVPRSVDILRLPEGGARPWDEVAPILEALPAGDATPASTWPYLEVRVLLDGPRPSLRRDVEGQLTDKRVRLIKLSVQRPGTGQALAEGEPTRELEDLGEDEVLKRKWTRDYGSEPPEPVLACFHELLDQLGQKGA